MLPEFQIPFVVSCLKSCGWVCAQCLALGSVGLCYPTCDMFSICDLWNYRMYKVKENLTAFHKRDFVIPVAHFSHPFLGTLLATPTSFSAALSTNSHLSKYTETQAQSGLAYSTHSLTHIQQPSCPGAIPQAPWRQVGWGELVLPWAVWGSGSTPGQAADCPGSRDRIPSIGTAHLAGVCLRAQGCRDARVTEKASTAKAENKH